MYYLTQDHNIYRHELFQDYGDENDVVLYPDDDAVIHLNLYCALLSSIVRSLLRTIELNKKKIWSLISVPNMKHVSKMFFRRKSMINKNSYLRILSLQAKNLFMILYFTLQSYDFYIK